MLLTCCKHDSIYSTQIDAKDAFSFLGQDMLCCRQQRCVLCCACLQMCDTIWRKLEIVHMLLCGLCSTGQCALPQSASACYLSLTGLHTSLTRLKMCLGMLSSSTSSVASWIYPARCSTHARCFFVGRSEQPWKCA